MSKSTGNQRKLPEGNWRPKPALGSLAQSARNLLSSVNSDSCELEDIIDYFPNVCEEMQSECHAELDELAKLLGNDPVSQKTATKLSKDGRVTCHHSVDEMTLYLVVEPPVGQGRPCDHADVQALLREQGASGRVDELAIKTALASCDGRPWAIARGIPPIHGDDGTVQLYARRADDEPLMEVSRDKWTAASDLLVCRQGDAILRRKCATVGTPGVTVTGKRLAPDPGSDLAICVGKNVVHHKEVCVAKISGVIIFDGSHLDVSQLLVITDDVETGRSIQIDGQVLVRGAVRHNASIRATGDIQICGSVEGASIESTGGNIELKQGVAGQNHARIRAGGSITTRFAENATLIAGEDIVLNTGSLHSHFIAGRAIIADQKRGQIIGGSAIAGQVIRIKQAGAASAVATELICGISKSMMESLERISERTSQLSDRLEQAASLADRMKRMVGDVQALPPTEREMYAKLRKLQLACDAEIRMLEMQRKESLTENALQIGGRIEVLQTVHRGVIACLGDASMHFEDPRHRCTLSLDDDGHRIDVLPLDGSRYAL